MKTEKDNSNYLIQGFKAGVLRTITARPSQGKSLLFPDVIHLDSNPEPEPEIIKIKDNMDGWVKAVKAIHEAKQKDEIAIDLSSIKDYTKQERIIKGLNKIADRLQNDVKVINNKRR